MSDSKLAKKLNALDLFLLCMGYIVGAGIFILVNKTSKYAKNNTWISFLIAGLFSILNIISYIELSSVFKSNKSEYDYVAATFGKHTGFFIAIAIILVYVLTNTTVSLAIGDYIKETFGFGKYYVAIAIILLFTILNIIGVKESSNFNALSTIIEIIGLLIIIIFGFIYINKSKNSVNDSKKNIYTNFDKLFKNLKNLFYGSFIAIFAYSGFETTVKLIEEAENPERDIPLALGGSIIAAIFLFVMVSYIIVKIKGYNNTSNSYSPITDVAKILFNNKIAHVFSIIAFVSLINTVLVSILGASRLLHGISTEYDFMKIFTNVNETTKTPILSIIVVSLFSLIFLFIKNVEKAAVYTNYLFFIVLLLVNISLFLMHFDPKYKKQFNNCIVKDINKNFPIIPLLASIMCFAALIFAVFFNKDD